MNHPDPDVFEAMQAAKPNEPEDVKMPAPPDETPQPKPGAIEVRGGKVQMTTHAEVMRMARAVWASGMRIGGAESEDDVFLALMTGLEAGLSITATLKNVMVVNGRPSLWGDAYVSLAFASGECRSMDETYDEDTETASCRVVRIHKLIDGSFADRVTVRAFSRADAETAGLWGKRGPWSQYPRRMLQMRARSFALRDSFADKLGGMSIREEVDDYAPFDPSQMKARKGSGSGIIEAAAAESEGVSE